MQSISIVQYRTVLYHSTYRTDPFRIIVPVPVPVPVEVEEKSQFFYFFQNLRLEKKNVNDATLLLITGKYRYRTVPYRL